MKFIDGYEFGKPIYVQIYWGDHWPGCEKFRSVNLGKSASFVNACVMGSQLLNEEMIKQRAPIVAKEADEVRAWAKRAGVFKV
jgi:hypothetical protein